jgi:hypothetical protein
MLGTAVASATGASAALQVREKQAARFDPQHRHADGSAHGVGPHVAPPTVLPPGQAKGAPPAASGKTGPRIPTPSAPGPLPGSQVSVSATEPAAAEDEGGSWWCWVVDWLRDWYGVIFARVHQSNAADQVRPY